MVSGSPVCGLQPKRARFGQSAKLPKLESLTASPRSSRSLIIATRNAAISAASAWEHPTHVDRRSMRSAVVTCSPPSSVTMHPSWRQRRAPVWSAARLFAAEDGFLEHSGGGEPHLFARRDLDRLAR